MDSANNNTINNRLWFDEVGRNNAPWTYNGHINPGNKW